MSCQRAGDARAASAYSLHPQQGLYLLATGRASANRSGRPHSSMRQTGNRQALRGRRKGSGLGPRPRLARGQAGACEGRQGRPDREGSTGGGPPGVCNEMAMARSASVTANRSDPIGRTASVQADRWRAIDKELSMPAGRGREGNPVANPRGIHIQKSGLGIYSVVPGRVYTPRPTRDLLEIGGTGMERAADPGWIKVGVDPGGSGAPAMWTSPTGKPGTWTLEIPAGGRSPFKPGDEVTWTTPKFGMTRYGHVLSVRDDGLVRVEFGSDGMEIRDLPPEALRQGWAAVMPASNECLKREQTGDQ